MPRSNHEAFGDAALKQSPLCYVVMPFAARFRATYDIAIKLAVSEAADKLGIKITCRRGDEIIGPGSITREIVNSIYTADVVIADLSGNNPNVFYELGIAHCMGNKTVMITQDIAAVPFDVSPYRLIRYDATPEGLAVVRSELTVAVLEILEGRVQQASNPVEDFVPIRYTNIVCRFEDLVRHERQVGNEVWLIEPNIDADLKLFRHAIKENIERRSINYRYLLPDTKSILRNMKRLRDVLGVDEDAWKRVAVRVINPHMVESEVVIYDAHTELEKVFLRSSPEEEHQFWFRMRGSRASALIERYEDLWHDASDCSMT
ncbi:MAG TPA: hypothetical protein VIX89_18565 [Bryobacteraceae bacterium]